MNRLRLLPVLFCLFLQWTLNAQDSEEYIQSILEHREHYKMEFLEDEDAPLKAQDTAFLDFFAPNPEWLVEAKFEATPESPEFQMATYSGKQKPYRQYGILYFEIDGEPHTLSIYQSMRFIQIEAYRNYLFLPFKDISNGESTYGGGRYIDMNIGEISEDNTVLIDFNKCYNPWCAYSDGYSCPIPPSENHLDFSIPAGEKAFLGEKKH